MTNKSKKNKVWEKGKQIRNRNQDSWRKDEKGLYGYPAFLSTGELVLLPSDYEIPMKVRLIQ